VSIVCMVVSWLCVGPEAGNRPERVAFWCVWCVWMLWSYRGF